MLRSLVMPMVAEDSIEYRCPGYSTALSGTFASFWVRLSYICAGSDPGRSMRPQPSRKRVSPATNRPSTKKHWLPGVWRWGANQFYVHRPDRHDIAALMLHQTLIGQAGDGAHVLRFGGLHMYRDVYVLEEFGKTPSSCMPIIDPPTWSGW